MIKKISKEERIVRDKKVFEEIKKNVPYRDIAKKYKISRSTVTLIKERLDPLAKKNKELKKKARDIKSKEKVIITKKIIRNGELIYENMLSTLNIIIYGVDKLYGIVENAENRIEKMDSGLNKILEEIENKTYFTPDKKGNTPEKDILIKKIYTVLSQIQQFYGINKILIDAVNGLKGHAETYTKLNLEANAVHGLIEFFNALFKGLNKVNDKEYEKLRNFIIRNSELGKHLFASYDKEVETSTSTYNPKKR